jgi:hypothetical protein
MTFTNLGRGIFGAYKNVETQDVLIDGGFNGISLGSIQNLRLRRIVFRFLTGFGIIVLGSENSTASISHVTVHDNLKGGIYISGIDTKVEMDFVIARDNGVAGIILEKTGPVSIFNSDFLYNRSEAGRYGNGVLNYSSPVTLNSSNFEGNESFPVAAVGCGSPESEKFSYALKNNDIFSSSSLVIAIYSYAGCTVSGHGSLSDLGGNRCNGGTSCTSASTGDLSPLPKTI